MAVKRRLAVEHSLSVGDRMVLLHGSPLGQPSRLYYRNSAGDWTLDESAARRAWADYRAELLAEAAPWTPWAARRFDGASGAHGPYDHLRARRLDA
ncbi:MAG: hypothetical protein ABI452_02885 [Candidatus Limnocylindrales bacterium]